MFYLAIYYILLYSSRAIFCIFLPYFIVVHFHLSPMPTPGVDEPPSDSQTSFSSLSCSVDVLEDDGVVMLRMVFTTEVL